MKMPLQKKGSPGIDRKVDTWSPPFTEKPYDLKGLSHEKIQTLVHALQMQQVELELQNNELRRVQLKLQAMRDEYIDLFDFSPVGYITTSADGIILRANMTVSTLLGEERTAMTGEALSRYISKETQDLFYLHRKKLYETNSSQRCELAMVKPDGSLFDARIESIPVADAHGDFTQIRMAVTDISDQKRMEKAFRESEEQLRHTQKMVAVGTMAGGIAHDFNNLLMVILGNIEIAENWVRENSKGIEGNLEMARKACMRAAGIIKQIIYVSRQKNTPRKALSMTPVVEASLERIGVDPAGIEIKREFFADKDTVIADAGLIHQVLSNLYDNALQAMEEKGGRLTIGLANSTIKGEAASPHHLLPGNYVKLSVSDTGPGIELQILDQIFTPYFTTKSIGKGSGLGLAVVYGILLNHNGRIFVSTRKGEGTTFDMYFPLADIDMGNTP